MRDAINYSHTAVSLAALNGHAAMIDLLIQAGAHYKSNDVGMDDPFFYAVYQGHAAAAESILKGDQGKKTVTIFGKKIGEYGDKKYEDKRFYIAVAARQGIRTYLSCYWLMCY